MKNSCFARPDYDRYFRLEYFYYPLLRRKCLHPVWTAPNDIGNNELYCRRDIFLSNPNSYCVWGKAISNLMCKLKFATDIETSTSAEQINCVNRKEFAGLLECESIAFQQLVISSSSSFCIAFRWLHTSYSEQFTYIGEDDVTAKCRGSSSLQLANNETIRHWNFLSPNWQFWSLVYHDWMWGKQKTGRRHSSQSTHSHDREADFFFLFTSYSSKHRLKESTTSFYLALNTVWCLWLSRLLSEKRSHIESY